jgi:hypothetical protein
MGLIYVDIVVKILDFGMGRQSQVVETRNRHTNRLIYSTIERVPREMAINPMCRCYNDKNQTE